MNLNLQIKRCALTFVMSMLCLIVFAQSYTVRGIVTDNSGEPIIGANVSVKGTNNGTITDFDGKFTLDDVKPANVLEVSYIGYITQSVKVGSMANFTIMLHEDDKTLDEVVVIGYGTMKKRDITGAVSSVSSDKIIDPVSNVTQALQGKLSGVFVQSTDGRPGGSVKVRVRGGGSITQSNEPLYIVDGFPVSSIADLSAEQIESVDVLKDAASTAIYGSRGANGVVLVTTRSAQTGDKVRVQYDGYYQTKSVAKRFETLSAQEYVGITWGIGTMLGIGDDVAKYFGLGSAYGNNYAAYANVAAHDYTDDLLRTGRAHSHNVSITGGSEKTKMAFNLNYYDEEGLKIKSGFERFATALKINQKVSEKVKLDLEFHYSEANTEGSEQEVSSKGSVISSAYMYRPIDNPFGTGVKTLFGDGSKNVDEDYNPVTINNGTEQFVQRRNFRANAGLEWTIVDGLKFRTEFGGGRGNGENRYYNNGYTLNTKQTNSASVTKTNGWQYRSATTLNWQAVGLSDIHDLSVLVGNELRGSASSTLSTGQLKGFPVSYTPDEVWANIGAYDTSLAQPTPTNKIGTPERNVSFFGRLNYSLKDKYLLTITARADASSKFTKNNRWGYFPAAAIAWRLGDESFFEGSREWLSNLKVRFSFGTSGSDNINSSLWQTTYTTGSAVRDGVSMLTYKTSFLGNPDLKWETTVSRNFGLDFGLINNRISGNIDVYWNTTKDLLITVPVSATTGSSFQYQNVGRTSNKGIEFAINANIIRTKDFELTASATYNYNKNNIDELNEDVTTLYGTTWGSTSQVPQLDYEYIVGQPVGTVRGFKCVGFYSVDDFEYINGQYCLPVDDNGNRVGDFAFSTLYDGQMTNKNIGFDVPAGQSAFPGAAKFEDVNKDGVINEDDVTSLGSVTPAHTGGFNLSARYKGFDFGATFAWAIGGHVYNATAMNSLSATKASLGANRLSFVKECFSIQDYDSNGNLYLITDPDELRQKNAGAKYYLPTLNPYVISTFFEDASYLRLNSLTLGYSLPKELVKHLAMQKLRLYVTASNLFTITGYSGLDPEVSSADDKSSSQNAGKFPTIGLDWGAYPRAKSFTFGLNVEF